MENKVEIGMSVKGLVCDSCDWEDMTIERAEYQEWIDKPCPKCGQVVLTQDQLDQVIAMENSMKMFENLSDDEIQTLISNIQDVISEEEMLEALEKQGFERTGEDTFRFKPR